LLNIEARERWEAPLAIALGYAAGCLCQPDLIEYIPARPVHWTPYLALGAAIVGALCATKRVPWFVRWLLVAAALFACAYLLTPMWKNLWPPRQYCIPLLAGYLLVLYAALRPLATRIAPVVLHASLTGTTLGIAMIIASAVAIVDARVVLAAVGGMAGYGLVLFRSAAPPKPLGVPLVYAVLAGGWAFLGSIQPQPEEWGLLLAPFAPAALWLTEFGPLAKLQGKTRLAAQIGIVTLVVVVSVAIVEAT
jgi:hypothetical protein